MSDASASHRPAPPRRDEAAAQTRVDMVSRFAHPRRAKGATFDLRQFVTGHPVPVALACLALFGGTAAAVIMQRRRRDAWDARIDRLRQAFVDAANGSG